MSGELTVRQALERLRERVRDGTDLSKTDVELLDGRAGVTPEAREKLLELTEKAAFMGDRAVLLGLELLDYFTKPRDVPPRVTQESTDIAKKTRDS